MTKDLTRLFKPRSIALVGCSPTASNKLASWPLRNLLLHDAPVELYPVNPRYSEIDGIACFATLHDLPVVPDLALVMVPALQVVDVLRSAESLGVPAAIVFGSGFEAGNAAADELRQFASASAVAVMGPNTNGLINVTDRITSGFAPFAAGELPAGDIGVVSQSGALCSSIVARLRDAGLGLSYTCAVGNGFDLTIGDFVDHIAGDEATRAIIVYLEGIADREAFLVGARSAARAGKAVVVLKGGRSAAGRNAVMSHTGSMVGDYEGFVALCEANGIVVADSFEELVAIAALVPVAARVSNRDGCRVAITSGSGAIGCLLTDKAAEHGFEVPPLGADAKALLVDRLQLSHPENPLDFTPQVGVDFDLHPAVLRALQGDPGIDLIVWGEVAGPREIVDRLKRDLIEIGSTGTPIVAYSSEAHTQGADDVLRGSDIVMVPSADVLFSSLRKLFARSLRARPPMARGAGDPQGAALVARVREIPRDQQVPAELGADLVEHYQIPYAREHASTSAAGGRAIARQLGFPVVLKGVSPSAPHKSDFGLVELAISDEAGLDAAYERIVERFAALKLSDGVVVVQRMVPDGCELIVGMRNDKEVGPLVVVGFGGIFAEILRDTVVEPAPVDHATALAMLHRLRGWPLLDGARGAERLDVSALADIVVSVSRLARELDGVVSEFELNPVIAHAAGAVAVDLLAVRG